MPTKTPRPPKPKALSTNQARYEQLKQAERERKEFERKTAILARAEKYPDMRDEIMAVYEKPATRKPTVKEREAELAGLSPEAAALSRKLNDAVKKLPKLPKKKRLDGNPSITV